jgi:hypothetical protein
MKPSMSSNYIGTSKSIKSRKMQPKEPPSFLLEPETFTDMEKPEKLRQDTIPMKKDCIETISMDHRTTELGQDRNEPP